MSAIFDFIKGIFTMPLGYVLGLFYNLTSSYVLAIVLLTVVVKLCFLPQSINQHKSLLNTKRLEAKIKRLKEQYAENPDELKKKVEEVRAQNNQEKKRFGCLPSIIQFVILISLFGVIYSPLTNVLGVDKSAISEMEVIMADTIENSEFNSGYVEITLLKEIGNHKDLILENNILTEEQINEIVHLETKYNFFGIDLAKTPELSRVDALWIIPFMVLLSGAIQPIYSIIKEIKENPKLRGKFTAIQAIHFLPPMMMFLFSFMFSAGVGLYWVISSLLSFVQGVILNIIYNPSKVEEANENLALEETTASVASVDAP